jgi:hypothetical protein
MVCFEQTSVMLLLTLAPCGICLVWMNSVHLQVPSWYFPSAVAYAAAIFRVKTLCAWFQQTPSRPTLLVTCHVCELHVHQTGRRHPASQAASGCRRYHPFCAFLLKQKGLNKNTNHMVLNTQHSSNAGNQQSHCMACIAAAGQHVSCESCPPAPVLWGGILASLTFQFQI